jgi:hypothetical protein
MEEGSVPTRRLKIDAVLFCLVVLIYGFFHGGGWHNQNSRFDAMVAFVEPGTPDSGTFRIDRFMHDGSGELIDPTRRGGNTMDWSWYPPQGRADPILEAGEIQGHYYSNKAPGPILLGAVVYGVLFHGEQLLGVDPRAATPLELNLYLVNFFVSVVIVAAGIVVFRWLLVLVGASDRRALYIALILAFCTLLFPYSTQLWGHPTAAAFAVMALFGLLQKTPRSLAFAGFFAGMAVLSDYLAIVIVLAFGVWVVSCQPRRIGWYLLGGALPLMVFSAYHWACFGSPFALAMSFTQDEFISEGHFLGLFGSVSVDHFFALLISRYRGILLHMPILLLSVIGLVSWLRRRPADRLAWLCLLTIGGLLALNASFNGWHGGTVVCARYQILALPFWVLCLKELPWRGMWRPAAAVLVGVSAFNMLAVAAVSPTSLPWSPDWSDPATSPQYINPFWTPGEPSEHVASAAPSPQHPLFYDSLYGYTYLQFWSGKLAAQEIRKLMFLRIDDAPMWRPTNAGLLLGLRGLLSLVPLVILAALGFWGLWRRSSAT